MTIKKPYRRNCRQFTDGTYANSGQLRYIHSSEYAAEPSQYTRAFDLIQKDLIELFDYVNPSDINLKTYSFRIHELLMRTCVEIEANFKAILTENGYSKKIKKNGEQTPMNMSDYNKLEVTHMLSSYKVNIPHWRGQYGIRTPFSCWSNPSKPNPKWYNAYHETKHNRVAGFENANFENIIDAVSALLIILSSQFYTHDFSSGHVFLVAESDMQNDGMEPGIGGYLRIQFPTWPDEKRYSFTYQDIKDNSYNPDFYEKIDYTKIN